jgi:hypothetical protein
VVIYFTIKMKKSILFFILILIVQNLYSQRKTLEEYLTEGLGNSVVLKQIKNQVIQNRIDSFRLKASWGPRISAVSDNLYAPVIKGWGQDEIITDKANFSALVSANRELVSKANQNNQFTSVGLEIKSLKISGKAAELNLRKKITEQYILAFSDLQQYEFNREQLSLLTKEEVIFKKLTEQGIYKQTDYLTFLVSMKQQEIGIQQVWTRYKVDLAQLNGLCGLKDTVTVVLFDPGLTLTVNPDFEKSFVYQQFINDSLKLDNENRKIDFSYKPKIAVYADAGYFSSLAQTPWRNFGPAVGININVPIYDGNQRKLQHDRLIVSEIMRQDQRNFSSVQFNQRLNGLMQQLKATEQTEIKTTEQLKLVRTLVEADRKLIESGNLQVTEYILALSGYLEARNTELRNRIERYLIINEINYFDLTE